MLTILVEAIVLVVVLYAIGSTIRRVIRKWRVNRALDGEYGERAKWTMELLQRGDDEFANALSELDEMAVVEETIVAESRGEFRERVVERANES